MIIAFKMLKIVEVAGYIAVMSEESYKTSHITLYRGKLTETYDFSIYSRKY